MKFSDVLLLSDFDMTLYWEGTVPQRNVSAIERFIAGGGHFSVATGRSKPSFASHVFDVPVNTPFILSNGALIYSYIENRIYETSPFTDGEHECLYSLARSFYDEMVCEFEVGLEVYLPDDLYANAEGEFKRGHYAYVEAYAKTRPFAEIPRPWNKAVFCSEPSFMDKLHSAALGLGLNAEMSLPFLCEVQSAGVNKGTAARRLANKLGGKTLVCVGDAPNDFALLRAADYAFTPSNATDDVKALGFREVCHCRDGAIADVIEAIAAI